MKARVGEKRCSRCERLLPLEAFYKRSKDSEARQSYCRPCSHIVNREVKARLAERAKEGS